MTTATVTAAASNSSVVVPVVAIIASVVIAFMTTTVNLRHQSRARQEDRREQRRREAALALGPTWGVLVAVHPMTLLTQGGLDPAGRLAALRARWESEVAPGLCAIAAGSPEPKERDLAGRLTDSVAGALWLVEMFVSEYERERDPTQPRTGPGIEQYREQAERQVEAARQLWHELAAVIRNDALSGSIG